MAFDSTPPPGWVTQATRALSSRFWTVCGRLQHVRLRNIPGADGLSHRQQEVLGLAMMHRSDEEIAFLLGIAPATVASHLLAARGILGVKTRKELSELPRLRTRPRPRI